MKVRTLLLVAGGLLALLLTALVAAVFLLDPDDYREEIAARASATLGREVLLNGPMQLKLFPWLALDIEEVVVGNPPDFGEAPALARIGTATAAVRLWPLLRGELEIGTVTLSDARFVLVTNRAGQSNLDGLLSADDPPSDDDAPVDLSTFSLGRVQFRAVDAEFLDQRSGERLLARIDSLELDPFRAGQVVPLILRGSLADGESDLVRDLRFEGGLQVAADLARVDLHDWRAEFELPAAAARGRADGQLSLRLSDAVATLHLEQLSAALNPDGQELTLELRQPLSLRLADPPTGQLAAAELGLNGQRLDLAGTFTLGDPLSADLRMSGQRLDLRPLMAAGDSAAGPEQAPGAADFSALVGPRLDFELDLDELILGEGLSLNDVNARARLNRGVLELAPLDAHLFGGVFAGSVTMDFTVTPPQTRINPRFSAIQAEQLARLVSEMAPLRGLGDLQLDLRFSGLSVGEILASLDGSGEFRLDDGALLGVDLRRLIEEKLTVSSLANVNQAFGGETPFRSLSGSMQAESGVITLPDLNLSAADFGASGQGQLDFAAGQVAYRLDLRLGESLLERLPRQLARATNGVIPLAISGPLARPVVAVDLASIAGGAVQRELEDRLSERLRRPDTAPDPSADEPADPQAEPERRERTSDLLLRGLRDRRERDREPPPEDPPPEQPPPEDPPPEGPPPEDPPPDRS